MAERFAHTVVNNPSAAGLVTLKGGRKYMTACATPSGPPGRHPRGRAAHRTEFFYAINARARAIGSFPGFFTNRSRK
jgi:hypothetical protein